MATDNAFPIDVAQIVALFLESLFYGFYLVTFGMCMYALLSLGRKNGYRRWPLLVVALLLFIFATLDVAFLLRHVLDAFIWYKGPGGAVGEFSDISYWVNVMKTVDYVAQTSIADGMLIYRCYIIYGRSWKIAGGLSVIWVAGMICEAFTCYIEFTLHTNTLLNAARLTPFITSTLSITLVLNLIATSLIVYKIWSLQQRTKDLFVDTGGRGSGGGGLRRAMRIIIESGAMYTVGVVVFFVTYLADNNAQYGVSDCVVQIIGIAFNLIIIRVEQGHTIETTSMQLQSSSGRSRSTGKSARGEVVSLRFVRGAGASSTGFSGTDGSRTLEEGKFGGKFGTMSEDAEDVEVVHGV